MPEKKLAELIIKARTEKAWSQLELAQRAGVSHDTVLRMEKGKPARVSNRNAVMKALGISEEKNEKKPPDLELLDFIEAWKNASETRRRFAMACLRGESTFENKEQVKQASGGDESS